MGKKLGSQRIPGSILGQESPIQVLAKFTVAWLQWLYHDKYCQDVVLFLLFKPNFCLTYISGICNPDFLVTYGYFPSTSEISFNVKEKMKEKKRKKRQEKKKKYLGDLERSKSLNDVESQKLASHNNSALLIYSALFISPPLNIFSPGPKRVDSWSFWLHPPPRQRSKPFRSPPPPWHQLTISCHNSLRACPDQG